MVSLDGASISCRRKEGMIIIHKGIVYAKTFYGGMVLFFGKGGGGILPHPPSTRVLLISIDEITLRSSFVVAFRQPWLLIFDWPFLHLPFFDGNEARINLTGDRRP